MFKAARLEKIREIIMDKKQIDVSTLSQMLSVTEVTIRSDLETLANEGFIKKTHGGATFNDSFLPTVRFTSSISSNNPEENKDEEFVAQIAAYLIKDRDVVFLGAGNTCTCIAKILMDRQNIIVVTNNLNVANVLAENPKIQVIVTGGNLDGKSMSLVGEIVNKALEGLFISKSFISVSGVDLNNGFTVDSLGELNVDKHIIGISKELVIVADRSKFDLTSFVHLGPLKMTKKVITNENIPGDYKSYFFNEGIQIFTSYNIENMNEVN